MSASDTTGQDESPKDKPDAEFEPPAIPDPKPVPEPKAIPEPKPIPEPKVIPKAIEKDERRSSQQSLPPKTTAQEDVTKAGQRHINLIWEITQATIALAVVFTNMLAPFMPAFGAPKIEPNQMMSNVMFLIVGFYFSRTNHTATGGVGNQPESRRGE